MSAIPVETIQTWLTTQLAEQLGIACEHIDSRIAITEYGLDSITGVSLAGDLEEWLQLQLSPTLLWDYPTIELLAQHLAEEAGKNAVVQSHNAQTHNGYTIHDPDAIERLLASLDDVSDADVDALLQQVLVA